MAEKRSRHPSPAPLNHHQESAALGQQRPHPVADGKVHLVKVMYLPFVATEYLANFTATPNLVPFIKDYSENRRLGTLLVFMDEGVEKDIPLMAIPINLSVLLDLPQDMAYAGFTALFGNYGAFAALDVACPLKWVDVWRGVTADCIRRARPR